MPINTTNLVSTPNIEGNIGQCQVNTAVIGCTTRINAFTCQDTGYATNSCTGKTDIYQTWSFSGLSWVIIVVLFVMLVAVILKIITKIFDY